IFYRRPPRVESMSDSESQASEVVRRAVERGRSNLVQARCIWRCNIEWALRALHRVTHPMIHPQRNFQLLDCLHGLLAHRLAQSQRDSWRDIGYIFAQDQDSVGLLDLA